MPDAAPLHVVMIAAEAVPFVKVGGLADVVGALPKVLENNGARLTVMVPAYKSISHDFFGIKPYTPVPDFTVSLADGTATAEVYHAKMPGSDVDAFFIGCGKFFYRDGVYDDPATGEGYSDNLARFIFFCKASLEVLRRLDAPPDVIHCHDMQTGMIPGLLTAHYASDPFFARTGTLFTIHNLAYQGIFPPDTLRLAGIDARFFYPTSPFEFWGQVNLMKVGIELADLVNTVSDTYAMEIQSDAAFGYGLEGVLGRRSDVLFGIVNGIDYSVWNPETDPLIARHYSAADPSGKSACKLDVLEAFGLPPAKGRVPLLGIVSRLADQKGFDLLAAVIEEIAALDLQMVVLGTGRRRYHDMFETMARRYPHKIAIRLGFDNTLAHKIEAGADMFLMPSRYEPCGLSQLYSLRYGAVPVVRATGGLADTVQNYSLEEDTGTGFAFRNYTPAELMICLKRALLVYSDAERWGGIVRRGMSQDWSWERSARKYMDLYRRIQRKRSPAASA